MHDYGHGHEDSNLEASLDQSSASTVFFFFLRKRCTNSPRCDSPSFHGLPGNLILQQSNNTRIIVGSVSSLHRKAFVKRCSRKTRNVAAKSVKKFRAATCLLIDLGRPNRGWYARVFSYDGIDNGHGGRRERIGSRITDRPFRRSSGFESRVIAAAITENYDDNYRHYAAQ